jgi:site-specific DNA recombinase
VNALYCRVSTEEQRDRSNIQTQVQYAQQYAALREMEFAHTFLDDGVSGTLPLERRPAGLALLQAVQAGQVRTVYVYRLDRLGRGVRVIHDALHAFETAGCGLVSMTESFETVSPAGKAMFGMLAVFAAFERDSMQARIRDGYDSKARLPAKFLGGPRPPFGYRVEGLGPDAVIVEDEEEAATVRLIFSLAVQSRLSSREIADHLNALGLPTATSGSAFPHPKSHRPPSGLWHPAAVARLLRNTTYKGVRYLNKRSKTHRPKQEQRCPALVDEETWAAAQRHLDGLRLPKLRPGQRVYLLRSLLVCHLCGKRFHGWPRSPIHHYYICHGSKYAPKCGARLVRCDQAEAWVWSQVEGRIEELRQAARSDDEGEQAWAIEERWRAEEVERIRERLEGKAAERQRLLGLYRRGRISDSDLDTQMAEIEEEQAELTQRWDELREPAVQPRPDLGELLAEIDAGLAESTPEGKQRVIALLIRQIVVYPKGAEEALGLEWR